MFGNYIVEVPRPSQICFSQNVLYISDRVSERLSKTSLVYIHARGAFCDDNATAELSACFRDYKSSCNTTSTAAECFGFYRACMHVMHACMHRSRHCLFVEVYVCIAMGGGV